MNPTFHDPRLEPIRHKVEAQERLSYEDGITLYRTPDLLGVGWMANQVRERLHGSRTYFNVNRHLNPTDVCVASCKLCAFGKRARDPKAYTMSLEEVWEKAGHGYSEAVTEFHIVGGLHPELTLDWYCEMLRGLKQRYPQVHLKAFTMVEIGYFMQRTKLSAREVLVRLRDAGMDSMPGGGAEIFHERIRRIICDHKLTGEQWLEVAKTAHELGLHSNCTMLYGHIENEEDRVDHLVKLRSLQDRDPRLRHLHPAGVSSRPYGDASHPVDHRLRRYPRDRGVASDARQHSAYQGVLGDDDTQNRADRAALRLRRSRRDSWWRSAFITMPAPPPARTCAAAS